MLFRGFLLAALAFSLHAQAPDRRYDALKDALGLSDSQLAQLQEKSAAPALPAKRRGPSRKSRFRLSEAATFRQCQRPSQIPPNMDYWTIPRKPNLTPSWRRYGCIRLRQT
jgi:hypothetical protein